MTTRSEPKAIVPGQLLIDIQQLAAVRGASMRETYRWLREHPELAAEIRLTESPRRTRYRLEVVQAHIRSLGASPAVPSPEHLRLGRERKRLKHAQSGAATSIGDATR